jgi:hypothetical protein
MRVEDEMNEERDTDERLWHPWLRINRVLREILRERWSAEAWPQVKAEFVPWLLTLRISRTSLADRAQGCLVWPKTCTASARYHAEDEEL